MSDLLLPFQLDFMRDAMAAAVLVALACGLLSPFLVLKGWGLIGDAIAHAVLPGVALAWLLGLPLIAGAFVAGLGSAWLTGWLDTRSRVKRDTLMGVVFAGMFAAGLVMIAAFRADVHLDAILFGNLLGIEPHELWTAGAVAGIVCAAVGLRWRDLLLHAFDPGQARAAGLRVAWLHHGLIALVAGAVVAALGAVGIILVVALLITPGAIGFLVTRRFATMLLVSAASACAAALGGVYASFWLDSAPAATAVVLLTGGFLAALAVRMRRDRAASAGSAPES